MTPSQTKTAKFITTNVETHYGIGRGTTTYADFTYAVSPMERGEILLSFTNTNNLRWFEPSRSGFVIIGKRGGVVRFSTQDEFVSKILVCGCR